jgi:hypothetical protein
MMRNRLSLMARSVAVAWVGIVALGLVACAQKTADESAKKASQSPMAQSGDQSQPSNHLGKAFDVKEVTEVAKLLADPKAFKGKKIHIKGVLVQHCHHRLAWFALAKSKDSKQFLRVWTKHEFLVPKAVKNGVTKAEAEGVVQIQTVPEKQAKHYATEHGFFGGDPEKINGPQYLPNIRVTGARFEL